MGPIARGHRPPDLGLADRDRDDGADRRIGWIGHIADGLARRRRSLHFMACGLVALGRAASVARQCRASPGAWPCAAVGFGLFQSPNNHTIVTSTPPARSGAGSGMLGTARLTGQSLGSVLLAIIFGAFGAHSARGPSIALATAAAFAAVAALFSGMRLRAAAPPSARAVAAQR